MKLEYQKPGMELLRFSASDVITTSQMLEPSEPIDKSNTINVIDKLI